MVSKNIQLEGGVLAGETVPVSDAADVYVFAGDTSGQYVVDGDTGTWVDLT